MLRGCDFRAGVTLQPNGPITLSDCSFDGAIAIFCNVSSQPITCDPVTYARLLAAALTFPDAAAQLIQVPVVLYAAQVGLLNGAIMPAASTQSFTLVAPDPLPLPGGLAHVQFLSNPNSTVVCIGAQISGGGVITVDVMNVSDVLTAELGNDQTFVVFYEPAEFI